MDPRVIDPGQQLVTFDGMGDAEIEQVVRVLMAMRAWRESEQRISRRSRTEMKLNETDMEALRYLVAAKHEGRLVTPGALAERVCRGCGLRPPRARAGSLTRRRRERVALTPMGALP